MNITRRIWLGFGILVLITVVGCGLGYMNSKEAAMLGDQLAEHDIAEYSASKDCLKEVLIARAFEKEFLSNRTPEAAEQAKLAIGRARKHLAEVARVSQDSTRRTNAQNGSVMAESYLESFQRLAELVAVRGNTPEQGKEGKVREASKAVEAKLKALAKPEFSLPWLLCQRHEKEYLLRAEADHYSEIALHLDELRAELKKAGLPEAARTETGAQLDAYLDAMKNLVEADQAVKDERLVFAEVGKSVETTLTGLSSAATKHISRAQDASRSRLRAGVRSNIGGIVAASVGGLLIALWVAHSLGALNKAIRRAADRVGESTEQIAGASHHLASSSQTLAEGAGSQAAALEETSAALEEINSMVSSNAESASQARELSSQSRTAADACARDMDEMQHSMSDIKSSSDAVAKIIRSIDEIAFQTNILALNAAVEAARAGSAGMGFAVVAEEVRSLAQRSAGAARETSERIEDAIRKTSRGVEVSGRVAGSLKQILDRTRGMDDLVSRIAGACKEQAQGIAQVNTAVAQMDSVTQSNAASAEESASACAEMKVLSQSQRDTVGELLQLLSGSKMKSSTSKAPSSSPESDPGPDVATAAPEQTPPTATSWRSAPAMPREQHDPAPVSASTPPGTFKDF